MTDHAGSQILMCEKFGCSVLDSRGSALCKLFSGVILVIWKFKLHHMPQFSLATGCIRNDSQPMSHLVNGHTYLVFIMNSRNIYYKYNLL